MYSLHRAGCTDHHICEDDPAETSTEDKAKTQLMNWINWWINWGRGIFKKAPAQIENALSLLDQKSFRPV